MTPIDRIKKRLAEIEAREKNATEGPWKYYCMNDEVDDSIGPIVQGPMSGYRAEPTLLIAVDDRTFDADYPTRMSEGSAEFIAASRTDIPALRKALEKAVKLLYSCYCEELAMRRSGGPCDFCKGKNEIADILEGK